MERTQLVMVVHSHQPVGNFDSVFEHTVEQCYAPFLEVLARHPGMRMGLHYSGCLLDWLEEHRPQLIDRLGRMFTDGQIELLGGGYYEPMLSVLPRADALGQLGMMRDYLQQRFGARPDGIWLTERVWEPELASLLAEAGVRYTLVDDTHFYYAGLEPRRLFGYYVTEKAGDTVAIFPIDKGLRYAIPFKPAGEVIDELAREAAAGPRGLIYGDDGEKFGSWPGTHSWVYEQGWLEDFFSALERNDAVEVMPPSTYLNRHPCTGRIYLPTASYEEMLTWAMPAEAIHRYEDLKHDLEQAGLAQKAEAFIRGGLWQNFMAKYTEANHLHKKMLLVSRKLADAVEETGELTDRLEEARRALYRGQCNCAYWHGLFGGLYLPHLRDAVYRQLIRAEDILDTQSQGDEDWISYDQQDFDADLEEELLVENAVMNAYIDPGAGGTVTEIDHRPTAFCPTNVLTRRVEGYHRALLESSDGHDPSAPQDDAPASIHHIVRAKESGLEERLATDNCPRRCFVDRFPAAGTSLEDLQRATYVEEGDFLDRRYHLERCGIDEEGDCDFEALMTRAGHLTRGDQRIDLVVEKLVTVPADRAAIEVRYRLVNPGDDAIDLVFCPELNLTLLAPDDGMRFYEFEGVIGPGPRMKTSGEVNETSWFSMVDRHQNLRIRLAFDPPAGVWRHPVETVSQSEDGFERVHQGSAVLPRWELSVPAGSSVRLAVRLDIRQPEDDALTPVPDASGAGE